MTYDQFKEIIQNQILNYLPKSYEESDVTLSKIVKNNDVVLDALTILPPNESICPTIYLDSYYKDWQDGKAMEGILEDISDFYMSGMKNSPDLNVLKLKDPGFIKENMCLRLVNKEKNLKLLEDRPYMPVADLAAIYYVSVDHQNDIQSSFALKNNLAKTLKLSDQELFDKALENTEKMFPAKITQLSNILSQMGMEETIDSDMLIVTNQSGLYGAAAMLYPDINEIIQDKIRGEYYLLPSSIHEMIILPAHPENENIHELENLVKQINETELANDEILSNHVYQYDSDQKELIRADRKKQLDEEKLKNEEDGRTKLYLLCDEEQKEKYHDKVMDNLGDNVEIVATAATAEKLLIIDINKPTQVQQDIIEQFNQMEKPVINVDNNLMCREQKSQFKQKTNNQTKNKNQGR
jgi:hypothetical protein